MKLWKSSNTGHPRRSATYSGLEVEEIQHNPWLNRCPNCPSERVAKVRFRASCSWATPFIGRTSESSSGIATPTDGSQKRLGSPTRVAKQRSGHALAPWEAPDSTGFKITSRCHTSAGKSCI